MNAPLRRELIWDELFNYVAAPEAQPEGSETIFVKSNFTEFPRHSLAQTSQTYDKSAR